MVGNDESRRWYVLPGLIALAELVMLMSVHENYGYFRDELYYLACSDHPAFGYVDQPPFSIIVLTLIRPMLGDSLHAIRFLPALASAGTVFLGAMMARRLGGTTFAQVLTSISIFMAPTLLGHGRYFSMNGFDVFFWALASYLTICILRGDSRKLWIAFGAVVGIGLLNKYSMGFFAAGLVAGIFLTGARTQLASRWFWWGTLVAALIFLPHVMWEYANGFPSLEFMRNASQNKNIQLGIGAFTWGQLRDMNILTSPLWIGGLLYYLFDREGRRFRALGLTYLVIFTMMVAMNAKVYYLTPVYPMMLAGGCVFLGRLRREYRLFRVAGPAWGAAVVLTGLALAPFAVPILPVDDFISYGRALGIVPRQAERSELGALPQYYADMYGWEALSETVAGIYATLDEADREKCVIYMRNYGQAGAIDFFGKRNNLPPVLCAHNSYWFWGPGSRTGEVAIIMGGSGNLEEELEDLRGRYNSVELVATTDCGLCMPFENGRHIFLCRGFNTTFQEIWPGEKFFI